MKDIETDVVIIGAGLTGLALAYYLRNSDLNIKIVEARQRIGGRISTSYQPGKASIELGATWLGQQHVNLLALLKDLKLDTFEQQLGETAIYEPISTSPFQIAQLPPNNNPSYRIQGGTQQLINVLRKNNAEDLIIIDQAKSIATKNNSIYLQAKQHNFRAQAIVSTLPPYLFNETLDVKPGLPKDLIDISRLTHTWMGDSIKVGLRYKNPFWRENPLSGTIVSNVGPIPEMYDHSNVEDSHFALKGFFNGSYYSLTKEERLEKVLKQLHKYYGDVVNDYIDYEEKVWANETFTSRPYTEHVFPHQNNGHDIYQKPYLDGRLYIGGSETSQVYPGYMEGAVYSASSIFKQLAGQFNL